MHKQNYIKQLNSNELETNKFDLHVNKIKVVDAGNGLINFSKPLQITNTTEQWNGTKYDIDTMDISEYRGAVTINHSSDVTEIVGAVIGLQKLKDRVTIDGIKFASDISALARFVKDMMIEGLITDFSIETVGPYPNDNGVYMNSQLVGLSIVLMGNNKLATVSSIAEKVCNSAKAEGLDTEVLKNYLPIDSKVDLNNNATMLITIKNTRDFSVSIKFKNAEGAEVEKLLVANETIDVLATEKESIEKQINEAKAPEAQNGNDAVLNAIKSLEKKYEEKFNKLEQTVFDNGVKEPQFVVETNGAGVSVGVKNQLQKVGYRQRAGMQIENAYDFLKGHDAKAGAKLQALNEFHLEQLKEAGRVENSLTIADFGNFVVSPELLKEIEGFRSSYAEFLAKFEWKETLSLSMAWLTRSGDINMQPVEICDDGADGNLKPISEYTANITQKTLEELAAVTPICNAATRFLAVDLVGDAVTGYKTDYDRKRAQLIIALMQQAVNSTGFKNTYLRTTATTGLTSWIDMMSDVTEKVGDNGLFVFNYSTKLQMIKDAIQAGVSGPLADIVRTGDLRPILGHDYIVVPNDLLPTLNTTETKSFVVDGVTVTINQAVFYLDPTVFTGRTSGGLKFDISTEAAYEDGDTVKSAFQRNEIVLRGSFFRGGAIKDPTKVSSMAAGGIS